MYLAAGSNSFAVAELLIRSRADVNAEDEVRSTLISSSDTLYYDVYSTLPIGAINMYESHLFYNRNL